VTWLSTFIHNPETHAFKNPSNWTVEHDATDETNERLRAASGREPAVVVRAGGVDHLRPVRAVTGHGMRWYVFWAAVGALAGYGVAMTIVRAVGWAP